ncbi:protein DD3-3-like isoform X2 [Glandiceps talaboti]
MGQSLDDPEDCNDNDCNRDIEYGMQEDYDYYTNCRLRERNQGLFTADQNLKGDTAKYTRQNANGNRYGYECAEERDYYPYWHPSPWKDIAIMTNDARRCPYYQEESANVKSKWACVVPKGYLEANIDSNEAIIPIRKRDCEAIYYPEDAEDAEQGEWREFPAHGIPAPICQETEWSRDNHLGNGRGGNPNMFNWTIPANIDHEHCSLRLRYNISTGEFDGWDSNVNSSLNKQGNQESTLDIYSRLGFESQEEAENRGYVFEQNPQVAIFNEFDDNDDEDFDLQLAINTNQYGRTFQDRSHSFAVRKAPAELRGTTIRNLNVRGKRGNIVQVYPSVEYDYVPNTLKVSKGDYVHVQWTGSNTNNNNNDGQGLAGTDRNNLVLLGEQVYPEGSGGNPYHPYPKLGHYGVNYPMHLNNVTIAGFSSDDLLNLAVVNPNQFRGELSELDDAGTYFDLGPRKVTQSGHYHYMCTRNNNFSNRSQKGKMLVVEEKIAAASIGWNGGNLTLGEVAAVNIERDILSELHQIQLEAWSIAQGERVQEEQGHKMTAGSAYASDYIVLHPQQKLTQEDKTFIMKMKVTMPSTDEIKIFHSTNDNLGSWQRIKAEVKGHEVTFETDMGGIYVARTEPNVVAIVGIVIGCLAAVVLIVGTIIYFRRHPDKWDSLKHGCNIAKKSTQSEV